MSTELSTEVRSIEDLEHAYAESAGQLAGCSRSISKSISMLQLGDVNESVARAVLDLQDLADKAGKKSITRFLPDFIAKHVGHVTEEVKLERLKSGTMVEVVDQLFESLNSKKDNIVEVMGTLFDLKEQLRSELATMESQEADTRLLIESKVGTLEGSKGKNLLVQVLDSTIKSRDRITVIETTINAAEASTARICSLLPSLQGELIAELAINSGLTELREFKEVFDTTIDIVEDLNKQNTAAMRSTLLGVVDLAVARPKDLARISNMNAERIKLQEEIAAKLEKAAKERDVAIIELTKVSNNQVLLAAPTPPSNIRSPGPE